MDVTTVADDLVVIHDGLEVRRYEGLAADTDHDLDGVSVRTLGRPAGELLCRFATVNDVHFGEIEAGRIDDLPEGPIRRAAPGAEPYPEVMNRAAGGRDGGDRPGRRDRQGRPVRRRRADRVGRVRGVLPPAVRRPSARRARQPRRVPASGGVRRRPVDRAARRRPWRCSTPRSPARPPARSRPSRSTGSTTAAPEADRPVFVMGHHQQWIGVGPDAKRSDDYFGLHPDASDALDDVAVRRPAVDRLRGRPHPPPSGPADGPIGGARRSRSDARRTSPARGPSTGCTRAG